MSKTRENALIPAEWLDRFAKKVKGGTDEYLVYREEPWQPLIGGRFVGLFLRPGGRITMEVIEFDRDNRDTSRARFYVCDDGTVGRLLALCDGLGIKLGETGQ